MAEMVTLGRWRFERESPTYTLLFSALMCVVCALMVAVAAVTLGPRQQQQQRLYVQKNVLLAAGLVEHGHEPSDADMQRLFDTRIEPRLVDLASGELLPADRMDARSYDPRKARTDPQTSRAAPANRAGIARLPTFGLIYLVRDGPRVDQIVLGIEGLGMWGTVYGFVALDADGNTVRGITYYEQKETPGLGGEIGSAAWQALWRGRQIYDDSWEPRLTVIKGPAGRADKDPLRVDGLSGATVTSNAISALVRFWFADTGYRRFLADVRAGKATP